MTGKRARVHTVLLLVGLLALLIGLTGGQALGARTNQGESPVGPDQNARDMYEWCIDAQGGTGTYARHYEEFGVGVYWNVSCDFGLLGSWYCVIYQELYERSYCGFTTLKPADPLNVMPGDAVVIAAQERLETMALSDPFPWPKPRCPIIIRDPFCDDSRVVETPTLIEVMVVPIPVGSTVEETALVSVNGCRAAGGTAYAAMERTAVTVICEGGIGDGLWCQVDAWGTMCTILPLEEAPAEAPPTGGGEAPQTEPAPEPTGVPETPLMPTVAATETAPMPTVAATEVAVEPTVAPTQAQPPPPKNDNAVPPSGPIEDPTGPEPPPTEAPLL